MALVHKALAVQKKERAKLAEEQAKLALMEARLKNQAFIMEMMQEAELARCERLGKGQAVIEYIPSWDKDHPDIHVSLPPLYDVKFKHGCGLDGKEVMMYVEDTILVPATENIYNCIKQLYYFFLRER
jgi:hypothetical protein